MQLICEGQTSQGFTATEVVEFLYSRGERIKPEQLGAGRAGVESLY